MRRRTVIIVLGAIIVGIGWYYFRPELLFFDKTVNEGFPGPYKEQISSSDDSLVVLSGGRFHEVAHETNGTVRVYQLPNGHRVLRFTEFETSNGPAVQVYLVAADDAEDDESVTNAGFIDLGVLKGNVGNQNYDIPSGVDLSIYRAVTIWCRRFGVNFGTAPLVLRQR